MNIFNKKKKTLKAFEDIVQIKKDVLAMRSLEHQTIILNYLSDVEDKIKTVMTNGNCNGGLE